MELLFPLVGILLGVVLAVLAHQNKRKCEDERMKNVIKQAIDDSKKTD